MASIGYLAPCCWLLEVLASSWFPDACTDKLLVEQDLSAVMWWSRSEESDGGLISGSVLRNSTIRRRFDANLK